MKILRWLLALLLLLVIGLAACEAARWPFLKAPLEKRLSAALGRPVTFGDSFGVQLLGSIKLHSDRIDIGDEPPASQPLLHAENARLELPWHTVIARLHDRGHAAGDEPLQVSALDVDRLDVRLRRDADGHANWQFGPLAPHAASAPAPATAGLPDFGELVVRDGHVRIDDDLMRLHADATVRTREGADAAPPDEDAASSASAASAPAPAHAPAPLGASAAVAAASGIVHAVAVAASATSVALSPASASSSPSLATTDIPHGLRIEAQGTFRGEPLKGWLGSSGALPLVAAAGESGQAAPLQLALDLGPTKVRMTGQGRDLLKLRDLDGDVHITGPSLADAGDVFGLTLPATPRFAFHAKMSRRGNLWTADVLDAEVGSSHLHGPMTFDSGQKPPMLKGKLQSPHFALKDLGPAFGGANADRPKESAQGRLLPNRDWDIPSLRAMDADVDLRFAHLDLGTSVLADIAPLDTHVVLKGGVLQLRDIVASTADGRITGHVTLDARNPHALWNADLVGTNIELARFITIPDKHEAGQHGYISGKLGTHVEVTGTGKNPAALLATMNGQAQVWIHDGTLSHLVVEAGGIDLAQALGVLVQGDHPLPLVCAAGRLKIAEGVVRPDFLIVDTADTTFDARGGVSLATERLDLDVMAHPHDFSPLTLRTPVHVDGTFRDPKVHLQLAPVAKKGVLAAALAAISPPAALLALFDFGEKSDHGACVNALGRLNLAGAKGAAAAASAAAAQSKKR